MFMYTLTSEGLKSSQLNSYAIFYKAKQNNPLCVKLFEN